MLKRHRTVLWAGSCLLVFVGHLAACGGSAPAADVAGTAVPVYNERTGRLEALQSDTNDDGKIDTLAHMDGVDLKYIEVDRDHDGRFDRWEYYVSAPGTPGAARSPDGRSVIDHAEEAAEGGGGDGRIVRREFYVGGLIARAEEDTDSDGRVDKWEVFENGVLKRMELDLKGLGRPTQRLVYSPNGEVERVEADPDGDGTFEVVSPAGKDGGR